MHVACPHGCKAQNESRRELQNGRGLGQAKVSISREFDWFLGEPCRFLGDLTGGPLLEGSRGELNLAGFRGV